MKLKVTTSGVSSDVTFKQSFFEIMAGYRGFSGSLYWGLGLFYGIRIGDLKRKTESSGFTVENTVQSDYAKSPIGLYAEIGYSIPMGEAMTFDLGVRGKISLSNSYKYNDDEYLKFTHLGVTAGVSFSF